MNQNNVSRDTFVLNFIVLNTQCSMIINKCGHRQELTSVVTCDAS